MAGMKARKQEASERGSIMILAAVAAIALLGVAAVAIDVGYGLVTKAELQNVADSAAISGNRELARIYDSLGNIDITQYTLTSSDKARIAQAAATYAQANTAGGEPISVPAADVHYGKMEQGTTAFIETDTGVTAVKVVARRDGIANGSLSTLMSSMLGVDSFDVGARSTAEVSPVAKVPAGATGLPVGISEAWFGAHSPCGGDTSIYLYPTGTLRGCAGWHTFEDDPASASKLHDILYGLREGHFVTPAAVVNQTEWVFTGGTDASLYPEMKRLYDQKKDANGKWKVLLPVFKASDCSNPSGFIKIIGFATAVITNVVDAPDKRIEANVQCDIINYGEGGGPDYGTHVGLPRVVG